MNIIVSNVLTIEDPTAEVRAWCKRKLTIANPDYAKKQRMHLWLGNTPPKLCLYEEKGNSLVLPFGTLRELSRLKLDTTCERAFANGEDIDFGEDVPLYDYQDIAADEMVRAHYGILQSPAGSGKTQMGIALIKRFGKRALWCTHTQDLLRQSKTRAEQYIDNKLIGTITEGKVNVGEGVTFATIQTMCKLDLSRYKDYWDVIIVDECFPKGTMVMTQSGEVAIESLCQGVLVLTVNETTGEIEWCEVEEAQKRTPRTIVRVNLADGKLIHCTSNHPIYTSRGYVKAGDLKNGDEVRNLREDVRRFNLEQKSSIRSEKGQSPGVLFQSVFCERNGEELRMDRGTAGNLSEYAYEAEQDIRFRENENQQSYVEVGMSTKNVSDVERNGAQTQNSRRKRTRLDATSNAFIGRIASVWRKARIRCFNKIKGARLSVLLQNRHRRSSIKFGDRDRRRFSLFDKNQNRRFKETDVFRNVRVESVTFLQQTSDGTFGGVCQDGYVYNLAVKHNHNYFTDGVLVHNCHRVCGSPTTTTMFSKVLNALSARHKIGLSATVHRSDGLIEATYALLGEVAYTVSDEAVKDKVMKVGVKPVATGVQISRECLNTDGTLNYSKLINYLCANEERNKVILEAIIQNSSRSCLVLSDRLEHLEYMMSRLPLTIKRGAVMISGKMTTKKGKSEREQALDDMRTGRKNILFSTYALSKEGLDVPRLERLFLTTVQKDYAVITQSLGRIARTCEGKTNPIAYDFVDDIGFCVKAYKKRCAVYRKNGYEFVED